MCHLLEITNNRYQRVYYAVIDPEAIPSTIVVLSSGHDLKKRFVRSLRDYFCWEHVVIRTPFSLEKITRNGVLHVTVTVQSDDGYFDVDLEIHQTTVY